MPLSRRPRVLRRASTITGRGASAGISRRPTLADSRRSIRSGYAFSQQHGFGELITTGSMISVRPRPRSTRAARPPPRRESSVTGQRRRGSRSVSPGSKRQHHGSDGGDVENGTTGRRRYLKHERGLSDATVASMGSEQMQQSCSSPLPSNDIPHSLTVF